MATIALKDGAPEGAGLLSVGNESLDVSEGPQETHNRDLIAQARLLPAYFTVEDDAPETSTTAAADYDPFDPHDNPAADHLSVYASESARAAAEANDYAAQVAHYGGEENLPFRNDRDQPTVAEVVRATFPDAQLPDPTEAPADPDLAVSNPAVDTPATETPDTPVEAPVETPVPTLPDTTGERF